MKKISVILLMAGMIWTVQTAKAQTQDTTKNSIEVKKKVRKGAHGRTVTKIKVTGTGSADAINGAADGAVTGHLQPAPAPAPIVITTPPPPAPEPVAPTVVVVHDTVHAPAPPPIIVTAPAPTPPTTTEVTTTTETKPVVTASATTHHVTRTTAVNHQPVHTYHKTYKKATATPATKTTTTTTVNKTE